MMRWAKVKTCKVPDGSRRPHDGRGRTGRTVRDVVLARFAGLQACSRRAARDHGLGMQHVVCMYVLVVVCMYDVCTVGACMMHEPVRYSDEKKGGGDPASMLWVELHEGLCGGGASAAKGREQTNQTQGAACSLSYRTCLLAESIAGLVPFFWWRVVSCQLVTVGLRELEFAIRKIMHNATREPGTRLH